MFTKLTPTTRFQSLSRMGESANKALSFDDDDDSDSDEACRVNNVKTSLAVNSATFMGSKSLTTSMSGVNDSDDAMFKSAFQVQHRHTSLQTINSSAVHKTPYPQQLHASINPFTPPANSCAQTQSRPPSRDVSLVRVAAANCSAIKQKASSMAMLSTEKKRYETPRVESARLPIRKCLVSR